MQAITIAIGKTGLQFFINQFLVDHVIGLLGNLTPPPKVISIPNFKSSGFTSWDEFGNISINLSGGQFENFSPVYQSFAQAAGVFTLGFQANNFTAKYAWLETYQDIYVNTQGRPPYIIYGDPNNVSKQFIYQPVFNSLQFNIVVNFSFDTGTNAWEVVVQHVEPIPSGIQPNIPSDSIVIGSENCVSSNVTDATNQSIANIDFTTLLNTHLQGILKTIPGSGDLGGGIVYDFSVGDSGILFPNSDGIQLGVKGGTSYNGTAFSGGTPPALPLPLSPSDSDTHHLNMYVSNYEVDALNWAYTQAGKLNLVINPQDLPDPDALKVANYAAFEPVLAQYQGFVMQAKVTQNSAPTTSFQTVYLFNGAVMNNLQQQLPVTVYPLIIGLVGNSYLSKDNLDSFLRILTVPASYFAIIEDASKITAMVLNQEMNFQLIIQNNQPTLPTINFQVQRTDVLTDLQLGLSANNAQTMQYSFANASNVATFTDSSIPGFNGSIFGTVVWPVTGEPLYAINLADMGKTGVPLPIMQNFQFDFTNAQLRVQEGYISILANVLYKD